MISKDYATAPQATYKADATRLDISLLLRGLTAIGVVWWHTIGAYSAITPARALLYVPGRISVFIFFMISGYLIGYGFEHRRYTFDWDGVFRFWRNRFLRVYPLFALVSVIALVTFALRSKVPDLTLGWWARQLLMLQWWHNYDLVGVFWTLGIEMQFYAVAPALLLIQQTPRFRLAVPLLVYAALTAVPIVAHHGFGASFDNRTLTGTLSHFQAGFLVNRVAEAWPSRRATGSAEVMGWLMIGVGALSASTALYHTHPVAFWYVGTVVADVSGVAILILHTRLGDRPAESLVLKLGFLSGTLSYGLYAWHGFLLMHFGALRPGFLWTVTWSLALAWVSYQLVELMCLRLRSPSTGVTKFPQADGAVVSGEGALIG